MRSHADYIKHRLASVMRDDHTLSDHGVAIAEHHAAHRWNDCVLCDSGRPWQVSRHLVGFPNGKEKHLKMVVIRCQECGNTLTVALRPILQSEKLRLMEALANPSPLENCYVTADFKFWQSQDEIPAIPEIMHNE